MASYNDNVRSAVLLVAVFAGIAHADAPRFDSPSVVVIDTRTHRELLAKHADEPRAIASMTKIFAALVLRTWHDGSSLTDERREAAYDHGGLPAREVLETILSTCYQASLLREEERPVRFRLIVANPASFPMSGGPPNSRLLTVADRGREDIWRIR